MADVLHATKNYKLRVIIHLKALERQKNKNQKTKQKTKPKYPLPENPPVFSVIIVKLALIQFPSDFLDLYLTLCCVYWVTLRFTGCSAANKKAIQRVINAALKVIDSSMTLPPRTLPV